MNLTSPTEIKKLLEEAGAKPKRSFGQNFLINKGVLEKIIEASDIKKEDIILEVGPGFGVLTKELAKKAKDVIAIEKDKKIIPILRKVLEEEKIENVKILNEDILKFEISELKIENYKLIANIPYNITSAIIRKFLEEKTKPEKIILMIQKEVAQRICEKEKMSILSLSVQFYAMPKILFYVSKGSFFPEPKVDSAVIEITPNKEILTDSEKFFKVIKAGFSSPRKLLASNLAENLDMNKENIKEILRKFEINEKSRAEDLTIQDWINLSNLETQSPSKVRR